jgi:hypothetical protein
VCVCVCVRHVANSLSVNSQNARDILKYALKLSVGNISIYVLTYLLTYLLHGAECHLKSRLSLSNISTSVIINYGLCVLIWTTEAATWD